MKKDMELISQEEIILKIYFIRGQKVMLDRDLAELYGVETKRLNEQVKRNINRFEGYMFQMDEKEVEYLRSQNAAANISSKSRSLPYVFTEHGILMLSMILNSDTAINVSRQIIQAFIKLRRLLNTQQAIKEKILQMERTLVEHDISLGRIFEVIKLILDQPKKQLKDIGFIKKEEEKQ